MSKQDALIRPTENRPVDEKTLSQLLQLVVQGEQDSAQALIQQNKNLLLQAGKIEDLSGREFIRITAFQYALWAMDWYMCRMIKEYLPLKAQAEQWQEFESKGTEHGKHFSLQGLIQALQTYVDQCGFWNYDQSQRYWGTVVGREQKLLPAHIVNGYCHPIQSSHCPNFAEGVLYRRRACLIYNGTEWVEGDWYASKHNGEYLGTSWAYARSGGLRAFAVTGWGGGIAPEARSDLRALQCLSKICTQQFKSLGLYLQEFQRKEKRIAVITDFFRHSESTHLPREIVHLIADYECESSLYPLPI